MKLRKLTALALAAFPAAAMAQAPTLAATLSQSENLGTARFMAMGGAFTALGGDLSVLGQNPAGIGVYNRSDIGATMDIAINTFNSTAPDYSRDWKNTKVSCNNVAYVGSIRTNGALRTFNWGVSYGRKASFNRISSGYQLGTSTSMTNYIAGFTDGTSAADLEFATGYNPYLDSNNDWLSILAYNSYMINGTRPGQYVGLQPSGALADADYITKESGYVDEYNIDFGGNVQDVVYWGIGVGITDLSYSRDSYYSESIENGTIYNSATGGVTTGNAGFDLNNSQYVSGSGWNLKFGVIVKPINELRLGFAIHTPTWYTLSHNFIAGTSYSYYNPTADRQLHGNEDTDEAYFNSRLNAPWRFMVGVAGVVGTNAILSADYERVAYGDMTTKYASAWGGYESATAVNDCIKDYYQAANIFRIGAEYRVTPQFSVRAGYSYKSSDTKAAALDGNYEIMTSGTDLSYSLNRDSQSISVGLGYRYQLWYIDAAYVYTDRKSQFKAYTDYSGYVTPGADVKLSQNSIVISTGFRF